MKQETQAWLTFAEEDFQDSALLWNNHRYGATIFASQQAIEKILKAYIIEFHSVMPSKTHRIELLLQEAKLVPTLTATTNCEELSKAYIRVRYPDLNKQYFRKKEDVEPLFTLAKELYLWIKLQFNQH